MPHTPYKLATAIHIDALYERTRALCGALGLSWSPAHTPPVSDHQIRGPFKLDVTTSSWSDGAITLMYCQEVGDNRPIHHMSWMPWYVITATLEGLPGGVRITFEGDNEGATELSRVRIEGADEAMTETILTSLGAQRPAAS